MNRITQLNKSKMQNLASLVGRVMIFVLIVATCIISVFAVINKIISE